MSSLQWVPGLSDRLCPFLAQLKITEMNNKFWEFLAVFLPLICIFMPKLAALKTVFSPLTVHSAAPCCCESLQQFGEVRWALLSIPSKTSQQLHDHHQSVVGTAVTIWWFWKHSHWLGIACFSTSWNWSEIHTKMVSWPTEELSLDWTDFQVARCCTNCWKQSKVIYMDICHYFLIYTSFLSTLY